MPACAHFVFYVADQAVSCRFYRALLGQPRLDVPGMSEFLLTDGAVLGLMPESGIRRLLGEAIADPAGAQGAPRAELYLYVDDPCAWTQRALEAGARLLSALAPRDWGDEAAYVADPDGHVLAFARGR